METAAPSESIVEAVEEADLVYTHDTSPGIRRERRGEGFVYLKPKGGEVDDEKILARIRSLAIPPAYERVWICARANGHLQATGIDARGRKQYRYHPGFREARDAHKFHRLADFGEGLPRLHARIEADRSRKGLPREKVLATVVDLLERSLIRVGNEQYAKDNEHYGLTTLENRHTEVKGAEVDFHFVGKSGVEHDVALRDRKLATVVKKMQDLPGQHLFQYVGEHGEPHPVTSHDVNAYLKEAAARTSPPRTSEPGPRRCRRWRPWWRGPPPQPHEARRLFVSSSGNVLSVTRSMAYSAPPTPGSDRSPHVQCQCRPPAMLAIDMVWGGSYLSPSPIATSFSRRRLRPGRRPSSVGPVEWSFRADYMQGLGFRIVGTPVWSTSGRAA